MIWSISTELILLCSVIDFLDLLVQPLPDLMVLSDLLQIGDYLVLKFRVDLVRFRREEDFLLPDQILFLVKNLYGLFP